MSAESPDITDPRIARAKAMRVAGAETAKIARACGVGVSTIYRWAEAHGFRVCDLEAAAWAASGRGDAPSPSHSPVYPANPCHDLSPTQPEWIPRTGRGMTEGEGAPDAEGGPGSSPGFQAGKESEETDDAEITAAQWAAMARGLKQRALRLTEAGRLRQAEQALRLAERYERMQASAAPAPVETEGVDYRALLEAKLTRLHVHFREKAGLKEGEDFSPEQRADAARNCAPRPQSWYDAHRRDAVSIPPLPPEYGG